MRITNSIQRQRVLRELKSLQDKRGVGETTLQDEVRANHLNIEIIQYEMTIEAKRESLIELNNKTNAADAREVPLHHGFKKITNNSKFVAKDFFEKDGVQYSITHPVWNGNKVRLVVDSSNTNEL